MIGSKGGIYNYWNCFKVLPTVYEESLSYYEVLCRLTYTIDQVIKQIDSDNSNMYKYVDEKTSATLANSKAYTDFKVSEIEVELNNSLVILTQLITTTNETTKAQVMESINELTNWLESQGNSLNVTNPFTGYIDTIQGTLNMFYNMFNYYALTCIEYDGLTLTAQAYDNKMLTAYQYDYYGKKYLWENDELYMFDPVTGKKTIYKNVIDFLVELHRTEGLTCTQYDQKNITTSVYDTIEITAYNYDWFGQIAI